MNMTERKTNVTLTKDKQQKELSSFSVLMVKQQQRPAIYGELELSNIALS